MLRLLLLLLLRSWLLLCVYCIVPLRSCYASLVSIVLCSDSLLSMPLCSDYRRPLHSRLLLYCPASPCLSALTIDCCCARCVRRVSLGQTWQSSDRGNCLTAPLGQLPMTPGASDCGNGGPRQWRVKAPRAISCFSSSYRKLLDRAGTILVLNIEQCLLICSLNNKFNDSIYSYE